jgi:AsmA protein
MKKDIIRGALNAVLELKFTGDQLDSIRKTLGGRGQLKFNDGAVVGLDLADMVRNVQTAFGLAEKPDEKPRTDFSEMVIALAINQGQAKIDGSKLNSPLLRLLADGSADLVRETLDLRITPKFVATLVGQGDDRQRSGVMVPVLVKGKLTDPKFEPDLKSLLSQPLPGKEKISQEIEQSKEKMSQDMEKTKEKVTQDLEKKAQELLKGLPFGPQK